jgi:hypothetical protein
MFKRSRLSLTTCLLGAAGVAAPFAAGWLTSGLLIAGLISALMRRPDSPELRLKYLLFIVGWVNVGLAMQGTAPVVPPAPSVPLPDVGVEAVIHAGVAMCGMAGSWWLRVADRGLKPSAG